jgi:purine catabolism regulator
MPLTMEDIMNQEILNEAKVTTAQDMLSQRLVEWISVIETPVENFVRKNELVLSTGIGCGDDPKLFEEFVEDIIESEASALAVAFGRYIYDIPSNVRQLAEKHNFIIIEIPWETRFSDIVHSVMDKLNELQRKELERSEHMQQKLVNLILSGANLSDISRFVEKEIAFPVVITNEKNEIKGKSNASKVQDRKWNEYLKSDIILQHLTSHDASHDPLHTKIERFTFGTDAMMQMPIQSNTNTQGYVYVQVPTNKLTLAWDDKKIINLLAHAATTAALWFLQENAIIKTEMRLRDDFVWSLAKEQQTSWDRLLLRAKPLEYDVQLPYVCILGSPENLETVYHKNNGRQVTYNDWLKSIIHYIEDEITYAGNTVQRNILHTYRQNEVIIFLEISLDQTLETVNHLLDLVERRLNMLVPGVVMSWGVGRYHSGINTFHDSYNEAKIALDIGRRQKGIGFRVNYEDTRLDRSLALLAKDPELYEITMATIQALLKYDEQRNMDLINTFMTYNRNKGNVSQTARQLNLHRQSLLYRLRKIETLTSLTLVDSDDLFLLDLSIRVWKIGLSQGPA